MATVKKLAGNWNPLLVRAWQLVHGVTLDQDDEDVSVPEQLLPDDGTQPGAVPFVPYCAANEGADVSLRGDHVAAEYNALERAVRSHALIQNAVAAAAAASGLQPWSPSAAGPAFDIAVSSDDGRVFVVEVKSATPENLELQLRIGLGQVLRYAHQLRSHAQVVIPAIAIELCPDQSWVELLTELGVGLLVDGSIPSDLARFTRDYPAVLGASRQIATAAGQASPPPKPTNISRWELVDHVVTHGRAPVQARVMPLPLVPAELPPRHSCLPIPGKRSGVSHENVAYDICTTSGLRLRHET